MPDPLGDEVGFIPSNELFDWPHPGGSDREWMYDWMTARSAVPPGYRVIDADIRWAGIALDGYWVTRIRFAKADTP